VEAHDLKHLIARKLLASKPACCDPLSSGGGLGGGVPFGDPGAGPAGPARLVDVVFDVFDAVDVDGDDVDAGGKASSIGEADPRPQRVCQLLDRPHPEQSPEPQQGVVPNGRRQLAHISTLPARCLCSLCSRCCRPSPPLQPQTHLHRA